MCLNIALPTLLVVLQVTHYGSLAYEMTTEERILERLFNNGRNYSQIFPKLGGREFKIRINITVKGIDDIKSDENTVQIKAKLEMDWKNDLLKWDAEKYNMTVIAVDASKVWTPTFSLEESIAGKDMAARGDEAVYMKHDGVHKLTMIRKIEFECVGNACLFPKDTYKCNANFVLQRIHPHDVKLDVDMKMERNSSPPTWGVEFESPLIQSEKIFVGEYSFESRIYRITAKMKRKPFFYLATVILPIFLLNTMSCLSIILPAITGDRIAMLLSCLLAAVIYLETTFKYIPTSSENFPLIIWLVMITLFTTGIQIVLAGICLNWANKEERKKKPGRKFVFLMFTLLKVVFLVPYMAYKMKSCCTRKRKVTVTHLQEGQDEEGQGETQKESTNETKDAPDKDSEMTTKSYRTAIKMVDGLAMALGIIILIVPVAIGYCAFMLTEDRMAWFCDKKIGSYIS